MATHISSSVVTNHFGTFFGARPDGNTDSAVLSSDTNPGSLVLNFASHPFSVDQLISYVGDNGRYYTNYILETTATSVTLANPIPAGVTIISGTTVIRTWDSEAHLNQEGYNSVVDDLFEDIENGLLNEKKIAYSIAHLYPLKNLTLIGTATRGTSATENAPTSIDSETYPSLVITCLAENDGVKFDFYLKPGTYRVKSAVMLGQSGSILNLKVRDSNNTEISSTSYTSHGRIAKVCVLDFTTSTLDKYTVEFNQSGSFDKFEIGNVDIREMESGNYVLDNMRHALMGDSWGSPLASRLTSRISNGTYSSRIEGGRTASWIDDNIGYFDGFNADYIWIFLSHTNDYYFGALPEDVIASMQSALRKAQLRGYKPIVLQPVPAQSFPAEGWGRCRVNVFEGDYLVSEDQDDLVFTSIDISYGSTNKDISVTLTGTGFLASQGSGEVYFGTTLLNAVSWSNTEITGTINSENSGVVDLIITNDNGVTIYDFNTFTFVKPHLDSAYFRIFKRSSSYTSRARESFMIPISESGTTEIVSSATRSDGLDIIVTDIHGDLLPRDIAAFSKSPEKLQLWVKENEADQFFGGNDVVVQWGSSILNVPNDSSVWSDYDLVAHLNESSGNFTDSSPNNYTGTPTNVNYEQTGFLDKAISFSSRSGTINFGDLPAISGAEKIMISTWINVVSDLGLTYFFGQSTDTVHYIYSNAQFQIVTFGVRDVSDNYTNVKLHISNFFGWKRVCYLYDPSRTGVNRIIFFINGVQQGGNQSIGPGDGLLPSSGVPFILGDHQAQNRGPDALFELFQISKNDNVYQEGDFEDDYNIQNLFSTNGALEVGPVDTFPELNYNIVGGALTENTEWTAGTYYIYGSNVSLGAYNLTFNTSGEDIIIKTAGNLQVLVDGSSTLSSTGSNKIIFTSMNDDTQGEVIQGSSGSPAIGDQSVGYINVTKNDTTVNISHAEFWYCEVTNGAVIDYGTTLIPPATGNDLILNDIKFKYCSLADGSTIDSCFIGRWRRRGFKTVDINYLSVDPTNRILQTGTKGSIIKVNGISTFNLENSYLNPTCNNLGYASIILEIGVAASTNCTIKNCLIRSGFAYGCLSLLCNSSTGTGILNVNIQNSIINLIDKTQVRPGIQVYQSSGTFNFALKDSIITNCYIGLDESGTINTWDEDYNVFYENTTNSDRSLGIHSKTVNPSLSDLPEEAVINSDFPVPNGYAVTNLSELERTGSDTFNNLSIDETAFSATGYQYSGNEKVTPGLNYSLSDFAQRPVVIPTVKSPVNTGQNVTIYLTGEVKFNPFEKSGVYIANQYAFPYI